MNHAHPVPHRLVVDEVQLSVATEIDRGRGLFGYLRFRISGELLVDGVALRRTAAGRWTLSYPERRDAYGRNHPLVRPASDKARAELERQVIAALGLEETPR